MKCGKTIDLKECGKKTKHARRGRAALGFRDAKSREAKIQFQDSHEKGCTWRIWRHGSPGNITFPTEGCCAESMSPRWCTCQVRRYYCERSKRAVSVIPQTADSLLCNLQTRLIISSLVPMQAFPPSIF